MAAEGRTLVPKAEIFKALKALDKQKLKVRATTRSTRNQKPGNSRWHVNKQSCSSDCLTFTAADWSKGIYVPLRRSSPMSLDACCAWGHLQAAVSPKSHTVRHAGRG